MVRIHKEAAQGVFMRSWLEASKQKKQRRELLYCNASLWDSFTYNISDVAIKQKGFQPSMFYCALLNVGSEDCYENLSFSEVPNRSDC